VFDRFALRKTVKPIRSADGRSRLLWGDDLTPTPTVRLTPAELDHARASSSKLPWSAEAREALETILRELSREGVRPGDRRQRKAVGVARAFAYLGGADRVEPEHLEVLAAVLWDDPEEQPAVCSRVIARVANPPGMKVTALLVEAEQVLAAVEPRNLTSAATAAAKLGEIERQLGTLPTSDRAGRARRHVKEQLRALKLASLDAV
jgi:MoxR-like ATPase